jgi:DNA gyrase/topoisomerase IV subunit A
LEKDATVIGFGILSDAKVIIQSSSNYFLNIQISTIPVQKRTSLGVKCINLKDGEVIKNVYFTSVKQKEIIIPENNKTIKIDKIKEDKRASTGYNIKI